MGRIRRVSVRKHKVNLTSSHCLPFKLIIFTLSISSYASVSSKDAVFILGGRNYNLDSCVSTIARFQNERWEKVGDLKTARCGLGAVKYGPNFMIFGGWSGSDR